MNCCNTLLRVRAFVLFFAKVYYFLFAATFFLINIYDNDVVITTTFYQMTQIDIFTYKSIVFLFKITLYLYHSCYTYFQISKISEF